MKIIRQMKKIKASGDLELLNSLMPLEKQCINNTIRDCLEEMKKTAAIEDYKILKNKGRGKMGLPSHETILDEIYLYDNNEWDVFKDSEVLQPQIKAIESNVPWIYIYFVPPKSCKNVIELSRQIFEETAKAVSVGLKNRYLELFG